MTAVIAMTRFQDTFHSGTTGTQVSVIFSLYTVYVPFSAAVQRRCLRSTDFVRR